MKIKVEIEIDAQAFSALMEDCGSNYWAEIKHEKGCTHVRDHEGDGKWIALTEARRIKGLQLMSTKAPKAFADFLADNADANTGDIWLQLAVLGEIVYG